MDLLEDLKMSLLSFNFFMIYVIHKTLLLLKFFLNYLKKNFFERFFKKYKRLFLKKNWFFSWHIIMENPRPKVEKIIKGIINLFIQKITTLFCN